MEPMFEARDAMVARRTSCHWEWARTAPAKGMMTSDGSGTQADWMAMRRATPAYPVAAINPMRRAASFSDMKVQYIGRCGGA